jgi:hypothetical protein
MHTDVNTSHEMPHIRRIRCHEGRNVSPRPSRDSRWIENQSVPSDSTRFGWTESQEAEENVVITTDPIRADEIQANSVQADAIQASCSTQTHDTPKIEDGYAGHFQIPMADPAKSIVKLFHHVVEILCRWFGVLPDVSADCPSSSPVVPISLWNRRNISQGAIGLTRKLEPPDSVA